MSTYGPAPRTGEDAAAGQGGPAPDTGDDAPTGQDRTTRTATSEVPTVLFLCVHNAGRSQMAAGWMRRLAGDRIRVLSGGSEPASEINPAAVAAMTERGVDITAQAPTPWTEAAVEAADVVVSMGCGDACPVLPGRRYLDWELEDPAGRDVEQIRSVRDEIERRVRGLMADLGVEPVDPPDPA